MNAPTVGASSDPTSTPRGVASLAARLAKVRPFPVVVGAVRKAAADSRTSLGDIARLVESDVRVGTDLLRLANAVTSGLAERCTSIRQATTLLGLRRITEVVTSAAALSMIEGAGADAQRVVRHTLAVAGVARFLAPVTGLSPDEAFTAGLLHDIGMLLLLQSEDELYEGLLEHLEGDAEPGLDEERALMGFDHATLGGAVLEHWRLPSPLPEALALHHDWPAAVEAGGTVALLVALLRVSEALVVELAASEEPRTDRVDALLEEPAFAYLGISKTEILNQWPSLRVARERASAVDGGEPGPATPPSQASREAPAPTGGRPEPAAPAAIARPPAETSRWPVLALGIGLAVAALVVVVALL